MKEVKTVRYNTNNAWGFGGMVGRDTHYDNGLILRKARNHHRHTGTSGANGWLIENITDDYPDFSIRIQGKKSNRVYVYHCDGSYRAFFSEQPNFSLYGRKWDLIKVVDFKAD